MVINVTDIKTFFQDNHDDFFTSLLPAVERLANLLHIGPRARFVGLAICVFILTQEKSGVSLIAFILFWVGKFLCNIR